MIIVVSLLGTEQTNFREYAFAFETLKLSDRTRREAGSPETAPQLPLGHDMSGRDPGGSGSRTCQELSSHGVYFRRVRPLSYPRIPGGVGDGELRGDSTLSNITVHKDIR